MEISDIRDLLMWCTIINYGVLLLWFGMFALGADLIYRYHSKWFPMSRDTFNVLHYSGMGIFKLAIFIFNLVPFVAVAIVA